MTNPQSPAPDGGARIDSWKAIARYLGRDERTVRRWERDRGLPVRRVPGGRGGTVFAYTSEIDGWLANTAANGTDAARPTPRRFSPRVIAPALAALLLTAVAVRLWPKRPNVDPVDLHVTTGPYAVVASSGLGAQQWRFLFDPAYLTAFPDVDMPEPALVVSGPDPAVFVASAYRVRVSDRRIESGTLYDLDLAGRMRHTFTFTDSLAIAGRNYTGPWAIMSFAVNGAGSERRVAVAAHDYVWNAGLVAMLDKDLKRQSTFAHDGWIESVRWLGQNQLLIGGFDNEHNGGMVALLRGTTPARIVVMPRSPVNVATGSRFNRAVVQIMGDRIVARTIEVPTTNNASVEALYEFDSSLHLLSAAYSDGYRALWRTLAAQGRIRPATPGHERPAQVQMWDSAGGWRSQPVP